MLTTEHDYSFGKYLFVCATCHPFAIWRLFCSPAQCVPLLNYEHEVGSKLKSLKLKLVVSLKGEVRAVDHLWLGFETFYQLKYLGYETSAKLQRHL